MRFNAIPSHPKIINGVETISYFEGRGTLFETLHRLRSYQDITNRVRLITAVSPNSLTNRIIDELNRNHVGPHVACKETKPNKIKL